ncbi:MAG: DUF2283 domain-containing protein [Acidobacteria bacterium]|nr:DUF2283 domain-containing protein [Acidobacteriota bacterium]
MGLSIRLIDGLVEESDETKPGVVLGCDAFGNVVGTTNQRAQRKPRFGVFWVSRTQLR